PARRPLLARLEQVEIERQDAADRVLRAEAAQEEVRALEAVTAEEIVAMGEGLAESLAELDRAAMRDSLAGLIERIEVDPATRMGRVCYRLTSRDTVASPRRADVIPLFRKVPGRPLEIPWIRPRKRGGQP